MRTTKRSYKKEKKYKKHLLIILAVLIALAAFGSWYLISYIQGNRIDPNNPYPIKGVDVSNYQGKINWETIESQDISFAFIKATEGSSYCDPSFERNWKNIQKTGMRMGAYHFLSYDTSGKDQAKNFISHVKKASNMLPPVIDVEFYGKYEASGSHPTDAQLHDVLIPMIKAFEDQYGMKPIIYTNPYIYKNYIHGKYEDYDIWISDPSFSEKLSDGKKWTFCQYSFTEKLKGYSGEMDTIDMNVFNGTPWEFDHY